MVILPDASPARRSIDYAQHPGNECLKRNTSMVCLPLSPCNTRARHGPWELSAVVRYVEILNAMRHMKDHIPTRFTTISYLCGHSHKAVKRELAPERNASHSHLRCGPQLGWYLWFHINPYATYIHSWTLPNGYVEDNLLPHSCESYSVRWTDATPTPDTPPSIEPTSEIQQLDFWVCCLKRLMEIHFDWHSSMGRCRCCLNSLWLRAPQATSILYVPRISPHTAVGPAKEFTYVHRLHAVKEL